MKKGENRHGSSLSLQTSPVCIERLGGRRIYLLKRLLSISLVANVCSGKSDIEVNCIGSSQEMWLRGRTGLRGYCGGRRVCRAPPEL